MFAVAEENACNYKRQKRTWRVLSTEGIIHGEAWETDSYRLHGLMGGMGPKATANGIQIFTLRNHKEPFPGVNAKMVSTQAAMTCSTALPKCAAANTLAPCNVGTMPALHFLHSRQ